MKSPLAPLSQRGVVSPFVKGRSGGIYRKFRDNYETINKYILGVKGNRLKMKKIWQKPKLIILARGRPEEFVLAGCKIKAKTASTQAKNTGCQRKNACQLCSAVGTS